MYSEYALRNFVIYFRIKIFPPDGWLISTLGDATHPASPRGVFPAGLCGNNFFPFPRKRKTRNFLSVAGNGKTQVISAEKGISAEMEFPHSPASRFTTGPMPPLSLVQKFDKLGLTNKLISWLIFQIFKKSNSALFSSFFIAFQRKNEQEKVTMKSKNREPLFCFLLIDAPIKTKSGKAALINP